MRAMFFALSVLFPEYCLFFLLSLPSWSSFLSVSDMPLHVMKYLLVQMARVVIFPYFLLLHVPMRTVETLGLSFKVEFPSNILCLNLYSNSIWK